MVVGGTDPLDVLARTFEALDDPEQRVMSTGGPADNGPIAKHYKTELRAERKGGEHDGIDAAETAWEKHLAEIRRAYDALDEKLAALDPDESPEDMVARIAGLDDSRAAVSSAFDADMPEITVDD